MLECRCQMSNMFGDAIFVSSNNYNNIKTKLNPKNTDIAK